LFFDLRSACAARPRTELLEEKLQGPGNLCPWHRDVHPLETGIFSVRFPRVQTEEDFVEEKAVELIPPESESAEIDPQDIRPLWSGDRHLRQFPPEKIVDEEIVLPDVVPHRIQPGGSLLRVGAHEGRVVERIDAAVVVGVALCEETLPDVGIRNDDVGVVDAREAEALSERAADTLEELPCNREVGGT
jgi:hypothetical protein